MVIVAASPAHCSTKASRRSAVDAQELNLVVIRGRVAPGAQIRTLADGSTQLQWDMMVGTERVPVSWASVADHLPGVGNEILVVGRVRRRFFRAGEVTQSRTEVVAERVLAAMDRRRTRKLLDEAMARIGPG